MDPEYTVGSLSALITGKKNKSKAKVIAKPIESKEVSNEEIKTEADEPLNNLKRKRSKVEKATEVPSKKSKKSSEQKTKHENTPDTIIVTNVPLAAKEQNIRKFFKKYGSISTIRFRGAPVKSLKLPKRVSVIKKDFATHRKSWICFVKFENEESAEKAAEANGEVFEGHHIGVKTLNKEKKIDESKAVFVGNLHFKTEDEDLWQLFEPCGKIDSIRIPRDSRSNLTKGFAYVNFKSSDSVQLALELQNATLHDRELNIQACNNKEAQKNKEKSVGSKKKTSIKIKPKKPKKSFGNKKINNNENSENGESRAEKKFKDTKFQGSKAEKKKVAKKNLGLLKKKKLAKKIAPRAK